MVCYGHIITFDNKVEIYQKNKISIVEDNTISKEKLSYRYKFHNNQNRVVELLCDTDSYKDKKKKYCFSIDNLLLFEWNYLDNIIRYRFLSEEKNLLKYWTLHTILPLYFTLNNKYYFLHAGAVEVENYPILFVADSYGGKSTITDFFIKKGHAMISDDKVATYERDGKIYSVPSYPYHRPYRKTEDLGFYVEKFANENKAINRIFHLIEAKPEDDIIIKEISGIDKFKVLRYSTDIDIKMYKEERFKALSNIANRVSVYNITIPWDLNRLEEVYQAIVNFVKNKKVNQ